MGSQLVLDMSSPRRRRAVSWCPRCKFIASSPVPRELYTRSVAIMSVERKRCLGSSGGARPRGPGTMASESVYEVVKVPCSSLARLVSSVRRDTASKPVLLAQLHGPSGVIALLVSVCQPAHLALFERGLLPVTFASGLRARSDSHDRYLPRR